MLEKKLLVELQQYLELHLMIEISESSTQERVLESVSPIELESFINQKKKASLKEVLFGLIDKRGETDAEIYKRARVDRRHFSKIRSNPEYRPGKKTVIALAIALELDKKETDRLLSSAGYALSECESFDLIIQYFIEKNIYDIDEINQALAYFRQKPFGEES